MGFIELVRFGSFRDLIKVIELVRFMGFIELESLVGYIELERFMVFILDLVIIKDIFIELVVIRKRG